MVKKVGATTNNYMEEILEENNTYNVWNYFNMGGVVEIAEALVPISFRKILNAWLTDRFRG